MLPDGRCCAVHGDALSNGAVWSGSGPAVYGHADAIPAMRECSRRPMYSNAGDTTHGAANGDGSGGNAGRGNPGDRHSHAGIRRPHRDADTK
ncbi:MAG: hypothetical protein HW416_2617 [Chloroflexi bacterium]|nr:hypothetical protein [Chloroflexota bacterium]